MPITEYCCSISNAFSQTQAKFNGVATLLRSSGLFARYCLILQRAFTGRPEQDVGTAP
jgi:hypothetical protein